MSLDTHVLLTVRGTLAVPDHERARAVHDATAGSPEGVAAARALGDLSHKVYAPVTGIRQSDARADEVLFVDAWADAQGIGRFFSNPEVQAQGAALFAKRDPTIWMRARGSFSYVLQAPAGRPDRFVGMLRGPTADPERSIALFAEVDRAAQRAARRRGLIAHELFVKLPMPGDTGPAEILGLDLWFDAAGMAEHYGDAELMGGLGPAFDGPTSASVWRQAGNWSEW